MRFFENEKFGRNRQSFNYLRLFPDHDVTAQNLQTIELPLTIQPVVVVAAADLVAVATAMSDYSINVQY